MFKKSHFKADGHLYIKSEIASIVVVALFHLVSAGNGKSHVHVLPFVFNLIHTFVSAGWLCQLW